MNLVISETAIRTDADGRYCLNDLHRSAGGEERHSPNRWTRTDGYQMLVAELTPEMAFAPAESIRGGVAPGTYVCKELVYAYAMWISAAFHLKVIRAYDAAVTQPATDPMTVLSDPVAMRGLLLTYTEKVLTLESKVAEQAPKVQALELIAAGKDSLTLTQTAKVLGMKFAELTAMMHAKTWIYRQNGSWVGYDPHIKNGDLTYKEANYTNEKTGLACIKPYCHVTPRGLVKLAKMLGVQLLGDDGQGRIAA